MDVIHRTHCKSQIRPTVFYGGCSLQIRRLVHLDDALLWENNGNCPATMTCSIIVLMTSRPSRAWWRHQMEIFSELLVFCAGNSPVTGEFPAQRPVTRTFCVFFELRLNQQLSKQWRRRWSEIPSRSSWRYCIEGRAGLGNPLHPTPHHPSSLFPKNVYCNQGNVFYRMHCNAGYWVW